MTRWLLWHCTKGNYLAVFIIFYYILIFIVPSLGFGVISCHSLFYDLGYISTILIILPFFHSSVLVLRFLDIGHDITQVQYRSYISHPVLLCAVVSSCTIFWSIYYALPSSEILPFLMLAMGKIQLIFLKLKNVVCFLTLCEVTRNL